MTGKNNRYPNWRSTISEIIMEGPIVFSKEDLLEQDNLFAHRAALFYTPTCNILSKYIGKGEIDIVLPIVTPDYTELFELRFYRTPRFWVDLIQRQTFKLRWKPFKKAAIKFTRYDYFQIRKDHCVIGIKALLDALKEKTSGRRDGRFLYYFGAIVDDAPKYVNISWGQELVDHPKDARIRIQVSSLDDDMW